MLTILIKSDILIEIFWDKNTQTHRHQSKFRNSVDSKHCFLEEKYI